MRIYLLYPFPTFYTPFFHKKAGFKKRESPGIIRPKDCQNRVYKRLYINIIHLYLRFHAHFHIHEHVIISINFIHLILGM